MRKKKNGKMRNFMKKDVSLFFFFYSLPIFFKVLIDFSAIKIFYHKIFTLLIIPKENVIVENKFIFVRLRKNGQQIIFP